MMRQDRLNPALDLALLQHLPRDLDRKSPSCALIACISERGRSR
jgi:hypothetical protein